MARMFLRLLRRISFISIFFVFLGSVVFAENAGSFVNTKNDYTNLDLVQLSYYSDNSCSTLLGTGAVSNAVPSVSFAQGQFYQINANAAYQIADEHGVIVPNVQCIKATLQDTVAGHTYVVVGTGDQPQFQVVCSGGSHTCTSSTIHNVE